MELVDKMNSGYSSLSTTLSIKNPSPPKEDEYKNRFRKVSLVRDTDTTEVSQDTVDFGRTSTGMTESKVTDLSSGLRWKNRFEGVSQYKPNGTEDSSFSDSLSWRMSDTYSGTSSFSSSPALPEATAYKQLGNTFSSSSPPPPEQHIALGKRLNDRAEVYLSRESEPAGELKDEWRRGIDEQEEPAAPAAERQGQREGGAEFGRIKSRWNSEQLLVSGSSSPQETGYSNIDSFKEDDSSQFTGVFQATLVELVSDPTAPPSTPPDSPDADSLNQFDMDNLVDTLKSMGPSLRQRNMSLRGPPPVLLSSLPPIVEDAPGPVTSGIPASLTSPTKTMEATGNPAESLNGIFTLPADLGLKRNSTRDTRSPLELMKQSQQVWYIKTQIQLIFSA